MQARDSPTMQILQLIGLVFSSLNPFEPEFRKNLCNLAGKLQLFRSVKLIETHWILKITEKFT